MTDLEKLRQWLQTFPQWEDEIFVDFSSDAPGNAGIFPAGVEEIARRADLLGNLQLDCRYRFTIQRKIVGQKDGGANAQWLADFQNWVLAQDAAGLGPQFGDVQGKTRIQAKNGGLHAVSASGIATYTVTLIADFVKNYQAI